MDESTTCSGCPAGLHALLAVLALAILALAVTACNAGSGSPGSDPGLHADLPGDPGGTTPDVSLDTAVDDTMDAVPDAAADACQPDCRERQCGGDGCGGSCGTCPGLCGGTEPAACSAGLCAQACCPSCADRQCGPDGCAGLCGVCVGDKVCEPLTGQCAYPACDWATEKPATWGPAGQLWELNCPADKTVVEQTCFDFTGDGLGDNGLKTMCNQLVATLVPVEPAPMPLVAVLEGVADVLAAPSFTLRVQPVQDKPDPPLPAGDVVVTEAGYDTGTCHSLHEFPGASVVAGRLTAGPTALVFRFNMEGLVLSLPILQARIDGQVQPGGGANGFDLLGGRVTGIVLEQSLVDMTNQMHEACDAAPAGSKPSSFCNYKTAVSALPLILDLHQVGDGTYIPKSKGVPGDAASLCFTFRLAAVRVTGFAP